MDIDFDEIFSNPWVKSLIAVVVGVVFYGVVKAIISRTIARRQEKKKITRRGRTYLRLTQNIVKYVVIFFTATAILQFFGVDVSGMITGLGLVSVVAGLAIQDPVKDMVAGTAMLSDEFFKLGDTVRINGIEGKVVAFGTRSTKIQNIADNSICTIANREIAQAEVLTGCFVVKVPVSYEDDFSELEKFMQATCAKIMKLDSVKTAEYKGITEFGDSAIQMMLWIEAAEPFGHYGARRDTLTLVKHEMDRAGYEVPFTQVVVHKA